MSTNTITSEECSQHLVQLVPVLMKVMRRCMLEADAHLTVAQWRILDYLHRNPGASLSELSAAVEVTNATASTHIEKLVQRKLVRRADHPLERRRIVLTITSAGVADLDATSARATAAFCKILQDVPEAKLGRVAEVLTLLENAVSTETQAVKNSALEVQDA